MEKKQFRIKLTIQLSAHGNQHQNSGVNQDSTVSSSNKVLSSNDTQHPSTSLNDI